MTSTRALVTGGCGFVGSRLCGYLVARGFDVITVDNCSLGAPSNISSSVAQKIVCEVGDVRDVGTMQRCIHQYQPKVVFHLAAMHYIPACDANPKVCIDINVGGTQAVLDACNGARSVEAVVLTSSAAVYEPSSEAHSELSALGPVDIYGHSKLWAEQLVALFHRKTGISAGIARLFNVFGPGETNPHIIPSFILQIQRRTDLRVGDLSTCRDYIFVDDVCSGLAALAQVAPAQGLLTCNLGGEQQYDGSAIVKAIGDLVGHTPILQVEPRRLRPADRPYLVSDCTRAHDVLGWRAQTDLSAGLSAAIRQPIAPSLDPASIA